ncbi:MAG: shikimate dehydrogenase [Acidobacteriota bacterium]
MITESTIEAARLAMRRATIQADMIEIRLDYLTDFDFSRVENLQTLTAETTLPTIITCRHIAEGGKQKIDEAIRLPLLIEGAKRYADFCDIEAAHYEETIKLQPDIDKLIVSYHDFEEPSKNLPEIYEQLIKLPAAIHKFAVRSNAIGDTLPVFKILERARHDDRKFIAIAMNEPGIITRILGCSRGSFLTYGSFDKAKASAPGQVTIDELRQLYRIHQLTDETNITGIIGNPVSHSASPAMHNRAFAALSLDWVYLPMEVSNIRAFFEDFIKPHSRRMNWKLQGFSVTIPHKISIMPFLNEINRTAGQIGAVNTVVIRDDKAIGYNTDVDGAMQPLEKVCRLADQSCAVIGAGGSARAVIFGLLERQAKVSVFARNIEKAKPLADEFAIELLPLDELEKTQASILINTTPIGMQGHSIDSSIVPLNALNHQPIVYDLVYNPLETRLLKDAREAGCQTISGLEMLVAQAGLQFKLWTGKTPDLELMKTAALEKLKL